MTKSNLTQNRTMPRFCRFVPVYMVALALATGPFDGLMAKVAKATKNSDEHRYALVNRAQYGSVLYRLMVAQMAVNRNLSDLALSEYLQAAKMTHDPLIAQEATQAAVQFEAPVPAMLGAEIWANAAPDNIQAQMVAITLFVGQSADKIIPFLTNSLEKNPKLLDQYIVEIQPRLAEASRQNLNTALKAVMKNRPKDPYAALSTAQSSALLCEITLAKDYVDAALALTPDLTHAIELKARLIRYEDSSDKAAIKFIGEKVAEFPKDAELRFFFASALYDDNQLETAAEQLKLLMNDETYGGNAVLFLGELYFKAQDIPNAQKYLELALNSKDNRDNAAYLLGQIEESRSNPEKAIKWYTNVSPGSYHVPAILRAVSIYRSQGNYDEAILILHAASPQTLEEQKKLLIAEIQILSLNKRLDDAMLLANEMLGKLSDDQDVLLIHGATASKMKKWDIAEEDFKKILNANPNNADALNALGLTVAFQKDRGDEGIKYLQQALKLSPNNPQYMDSLGWVQYQLGNNKEALQYLKRAQELSNDSEIATRFGEVLWVSGEKEHALKIFKTIMEKTPKNEYFLQTVQRLKVDPSYLSKQ